MKRLFTKRGKSAKANPTAESASPAAPLSTPAALPPGVVPYLSPAPTPETIDTTLVRPRPTYASPTSSFAPSVGSPVVAPAPYPTPPASHQSHSLNQSQGSATSPIDVSARSSGILQGGGSRLSAVQAGLSPIRTPSQGPRSAASDVSASDNEGKLSVG